MLVIGLSKLEAYGSAHPEAGMALTALHALLSAAVWTDPDDALRQWPGLVRRDERGLSVVLQPEGCEILLQVNFPLGIVQIQAVQSLSPQGASSDERQRATHPDTGGLRASPA